MFGNIFVLNINGDYMEKNKEYEAKSLNDTIMEILIESASPVRIKSSDIEFKKEFAEILRIYDSSFRFLSKN